MREEQLAKRRPSRQPISLTLPRGDYMRPARYQLLLEKSVDACLAALEVYNKPDFRYREESFSILMLNAWELLLKARVLRENDGKMRSIEVWEPRRKKDGSISKIQQKKLNRSGNPMTIGIDRTIELVRQFPTDSIDPAFPR
jgi:hypothetical protein